MQKFSQNPFSPPGARELQTELGEELLSALMELGEFVAVSSDVIFRKPDYQRMVDTIRNEIEQKGKITLGEVRDLFQTSRKYAQALLEHLDAKGVTLRDGDFRKLKQK
jgi:selenocysteine-specific elongation factor